MLDKFADPVLIEQMPLGAKISAALFVTVMGMLITFAALIVLWGLTVLYSKVVRSFENKNTEQKAPSVSPAPAATPQVQSDQGEDEELVAVIAAAIAAATGKKPHNLVVRQIRQIVDATPAWGQAGRVQQMNSRL